MQNNCQVLDPLLLSVIEILITALHGLLIKNKKTVPTVMDSLNTLSALQNVGQSLWLANTTLVQLGSGALLHYIREGMITGALIDPLSCSRVIQESDTYDEAIRKKLASGLFGERLALALSLDDARHAADLLRPVYDTTDGVDGWVALAILPPPAADSASALQEISRFHARVRRPNILVTLAGLPEWLAVVEEAIYAGVPLNIACLFSAEHYSHAAQAYLRAVERRIAAGLNPAITTFASIAINHFEAALSPELASERRSRRVIAMARKIHRTSRELHNSQRWERACNAGARPLRLIWKMETGSGWQPRDSRLVQGLVAPLTVAAIPETAVEALARENMSSLPMPKNGQDCDEVLARYRRRGIDLSGFADVLQQTEAKTQFGSWIALLEAVASKSALMTME